VARSSRQPAEVTVNPRRTTTLDPARMKLNHRAWLNLKRKFKSHSKIHHSGCWLVAHGLCLLDGVPIDYGSTGMPDSFETDHKVPRSVRPDLWLEWANLRASHLRCNRSRQAKDVGAQHIWVRPRF
jgi:5-methylcytosine-specific restriction endonuclease McrA